MKQKNLIQALVGGFPFLLAVAVVGGLFFYYFGPSDFGMAAARSNADNEMLRAVPISEEGVAGSLKIFRDVLGGQEKGEAGAENRAGKYLDSTLGIRNTGYGINRPLAGVGSMGWSVVEAELRGVRKPDEVVLVKASMGQRGGGGGDSTGVAALLSVARAMVSDTPERTIRFVFDVDDDHVRQRYAEVLREENLRIVDYIEIGDSLAGEISVETGEGFQGLAFEKRRRISSVADGEVTPAGLAEVAKQIQTTVRQAGRTQK